MKVIGQPCHLRLRHQLLIRYTLAQLSFQLSDLGQESATNTAPVRSAKDFPGNTIAPPTHFSFNPATTLFIRRRQTPFNSSKKSRINATGTCRRCSRRNPVVILHNEGGGPKVAKLSSGHLTLAAYSLNRRRGTNLAASPGIQDSSSASGSARGVVCMP